MTDMIEKVARAIRENFPHQYAGMVGRPIWEDMGPESREPWLKMARAAISALMEPTENMITHGHAEGVRKNMLWADMPGGNIPLRIQQEYLPAAWQAMLKAALDE